MDLSALNRLCGVFKTNLFDVSGLKDDTISHDNSLRFHFYTTWGCVYSVFRDHIDRDILYQNSLVDESDPICRVLNINIDEALEVHGSMIIYIDDLTNKDVCKKFTIMFSTPNGNIYDFGIDIDITIEQNTNIIEIYTNLLKLFRLNK